jgi:hypothetical protein
MDSKNDILGCFVSSGEFFSDAPQEEKNLVLEKGALFRTYIWGENGISAALKKLKRETYGEDLMLILFQFYVNPLPITLQNLKEIGAYRKKGKSIGISICVNDENFFNKSDEARRALLKNAILQKLDLLAEVVGRRHLDTNIKLLKTDLEAVLQ